MTIDIDLLRTMVTVVSFVTFIGILWYAMKPGNAERFLTAAQLPPDEEGK